jgi:hypothetical protein
MKEFPKGAAAADEKTISAHVPFDKACRAASKAIIHCGWKLTEINLEKGHFNGKIGRSINTLHGQLITIDVAKLDENSSNIHVRCEAYNQLLDYGKNKEMIDKFKAELQNQIMHN